MMTRKSVVGTSVVFLAVASLVIPGCGSSLIDVEDIVGVNGTYDATTLRFEGSPILDSMMLRLVADPEDPYGGPTTGTLEATDGPAGATSVDLEGSWRVDDQLRTVNFAFDASDELLDDLEQLDFAVQRRRLEGEGTVEGNAYVVVLEQR